MFDFIMKSHRNLFEVLELPDYIFAVNAELFLQYGQLRSEPCIFGFINNITNMVQYDDGLVFFVN